MEMLFALFTRDNKNSHQAIQHKGPIPEVFMGDRRTIFVVHGWTNSLESDYMTDIKDALLEREDANVILVEWKKGASYNPRYYKSATNTRVVGAEIAFIMRRLMNEYKNTTPDSLWCIGHSLGAHSCAFAGETTKFKRITGLSPAGPGFQNRDAIGRLSKDDAELVDVIHTDTHGIHVYKGMELHTGDVDFYPNGGYNQPGCKYGRKRDQSSVSTYGLFDGLSGWGEWSFGCSHNRAPRLFIASIRYPNCFVTKKRCTDHTKIPESCNEDCTTDTCPEMGYNADKGMPHRIGNYYLITGSEEVKLGGNDPYCRE